MEVTLHTGSLFSPEETDAQGVFRVVSTRPFDKDAVLDAFSLTLGVPKDELASVHTHQLRSLGGMPAALGGIAFLCLLAYLMFVGCAPVAHSKVIGVERLLGWGRLAIWLQLITPALAAQLAAAILCDVAILALVAPLSFEFLALLVALQVGLVCLSALAGLTALAVVSSIPATAAIGRAFSLRLPVGIAAVVKLAIVAGGGLAGGVEPRPPPVAVRQHCDVPWHGGTIQSLDHLGLVGGVEPGRRPDAIDEPACRRHAPRVDPGSGTHPHP